jgi:Tfp pilus assembly ATPase PilU
VNLGSWVRRRTWGRALGVDLARIDSIFKMVKEQGASDLHISTGAPPMLRVQGEIRPIE